MGFKAPRGYGFFTNPKKALYDRIYNRTTVPVGGLLKPGRSSVRPEFGGRLDFGEDAVAILVAGTIMVGFLVWIGLGFKFALFLAVLGISGAVLGVETLTGIVIFAFAAWVFLH